MIKNPYGMKDGKLVHISEIAEGIHGKKCNCTCPACGKMLSAKRGNNNVEHFAHCECNCEPESILHRVAKELIKESYYIALPEFRIDKNNKYLKEYIHKVEKNYVYFKKHESSHPQILQYLNSLIKSFDILYKTYGGVVLEQEVNYVFSKVDCEKYIDLIKPDIIIYRDDIPTIIEIAKSSFVEEIKMKKIIQLGISAIEIDISKIKPDKYKDRETFKEFLIKDTKLKSWIYNSREKNLVDTFIHDCTRNVKYAPIKLKSNREEKYQNHEEFYIKNKSPYNDKKIIEKRKVILKNREEFSWDNLNYRPSKDIDIITWGRLRDSLKLSKLISTKVPPVIDIPILGEEFIGCPRYVWQSKICEEFIINNTNGKTTISNIVNMLIYNDSIAVNPEFICNYNEMYDSISNIYTLVYEYVVYLFQLGFIDIMNFLDNRTTLVTIRKDIENFDIGKLKRESKIMYNFCEYCGEFVKLKEKLCDDCQN